MADDQLRARITNLATGLPRRRRALLSIPATHPLADQRALQWQRDGLSLRVPCHRVGAQGRHSALFAVPEVWGPADDDSHTGRLLCPDQEIDTGGGCRLHEWIFRSDLLSVLPRPVVRIGQASYRLDGWGLEVLQETPAHILYRIQGSMKSQGMHWRVWMRAWADDPVLWCAMKLVWSDRLTPDVDRWVDSVMVESGFPLVCDTARADGVSDPFFSGGSWWLHLSRRRGFIDASSIRYYGRMLCCSDAALAYEQNPESPDALAVEDCIAGWHGDVEAALCPGEWDGAWLVGKRTPAWQGASWDEAEASHRSFASIATTPGDLYQSRPLGLMKSAASAGNQEDFAITKGSFAVTLGDPRWLALARYCSTLNFRGVEQFDHGGQMLRAKDHPGWLTWNGRTNLRAAPDRLGKPEAKNLPPGAFTSTGWSGLDDQHRSRLNDWALLALTGCPMLEDTFRFHVETDIAMHNDRLGAPRAIGRLFIDWAHALLLLDDEAVQALLPRIREKRAVFLREWRGGDVSGPVKVVSYQADPRYPIYDPATGDLRPYWSTWEQAWAAVGCLWLGMVLEDLELTRAGVMLCRTVTNYGFYEHQDKWYGTYGVRYLDPGGPREGQPLPAEAYHPASWQVLTRETGWQRYSTQEWAFLAVLGFLMAGPHSDAQHDELERARRLCRFYTAKHRVAPTRRQAELWSFARSVIEDVNS